jgi:hypothetical protein
MSPWVGTYAKDKCHKKEHTTWSCMRSRCRRLSPKRSIASGPRLSRARRCRYNMSWQRMVAHNKDIRREHGMQILLLIGYKKEQRRTQWFQVVQAKPADKSPCRSSRARMNPRCPAGQARAPMCTWILVRGIGMAVKMIRGECRD